MKENVIKNQFIKLKEMPKTKRTFLIIDAVLILLLIVSGVVSLNIKAESEDHSKYNVTFDSNGGSIVENQEVLKNNKATKPVNPTKEDYVFVEWRLNGVAYDFNTPITKDIVLVAEWQVDVKPKYIITFDSSGGTEVAPIEVREGSTAIPPTNPTKTNYNFNGWYLNDAFFDFNTPITGNITLVAKWEKIVATPPKKAKPKPSTPATPTPPAEVIKKYQREYLPGGSSTVGQASLAARILFSIIFNDK